MRVVAHAPVLPDPRVFAALGDPTRLLLVERLHATPRQSITSLCQGMTVTRQAVTKHLRVLADAGLVKDARSGREHTWSLDAAPLAEVSAWVERYRGEWEARLDRLQAFLEKAPPPPPSPSARRR